VGVFVGKNVMPGFGVGVTVAVATVVDVAVADGGRVGIEVADACRSNRLATRTGVLFTGLTATVGLLLPPRPENNGATAE
jgi:hypothetical protein